MLPRNLVIAGSAGQLAERLMRIAAERGANASRSVPGGVCPSDADVWYFAGPDAEDVHAFRGARSLQFVRTPYGGTDGSRWLRGDERPSWNEPPPFCTRLFTTSLTIDADGRSRDGFLHFLATLFDLKTEIEERGVDYFEYRALRFPADADGRINLIRTEDAAALMLAIAERGEPGRYVIASPESDPLADVLERAGVAFGVSVLAEEDRARMTAIDDLFELRLHGFQRHLGAPARALVEQSCLAADVDAETLIVDAQEQEALFAAAVRALEEQRRAFVARVASYPDPLQRIAIDRDGGPPLVYHAAGKGPRTIVLLNAFRQPLEFWFRLIELLRNGSRVLIAEPYDLASGDGSVAALADDVDAMLNAEGVDQCHLVGWCTGPRVGVEYVLRHPERVRAMVFLNTTLRCTGGPPEFCSAFEKNFDVLMRMLEERPAMAASMIQSLRTSAEVDDGLGELLRDPDVDVAPNVLARINGALRRAVAAPFASTEALVQFTRGVDEFWSYDIRERAAAVEVPVLFLSAEHDRVAVPEGSSAAAALFPQARHVHVPGATHYFLFDRADVTAALIETFLDTATARAERVYGLGHDSQRAVAGVGS